MSVPHVCASVCYGVLFYHYKTAVWVAIQM